MLAVRVILFFLQLFTQNTIFNVQLLPRTKNFLAGVAAMVRKSVNCSLFFQLRKAGLQNQYAVSAYPTPLT
jgi:hypothetical protein